MSLYQVSFRSSYRAPGELSAKTVTPKQKGDFGALGDTQNGKFQKNEITTVTTPAHHLSPRAPPPPHLRIGTTGSAYGQRVPSGEMENSKKMKRPQLQPPHTTQVHVSHP